MLDINIKQVLLDKGISKPYTFLRSLHISSDMAHKLLSGNYKRLDLKVINKICYSAWCTPNDLLTWTPPDPMSNIPNHPLQALKAKERMEIMKKIQRLSREQLILINQQLSDMTLPAPAQKETEV